MTLAAAQTLHLDQAVLESYPPVDIKNDHF